MLLAFALAASDISLVGRPLTAEATPNDAILGRWDITITCTVFVGVSSPNGASAAIATELGLSDGTIRNYLSGAISKLGAANRVDAARIARHKGWL